MPEPDDNLEHHAERKVVYETVSTSSSRGMGITVAIIAIVAIALIVWVVMQMR